MTDSLKLRIQEDMKTAMRAQEKERLGTIRMLMAAIKQREVDERITLDDTQIVAVLDKMIKQRRDSFSQFSAAGRTDLADKESREIEVLQSYMPQALSEAELTALITAVIAETGATSIKDLGKVMGLLKPQVQGRADMSVVSTELKKRLG
ncbi:GatB/YqeY domain-containing protein [Beggiatoa leptomitoformis]|uniref:GatB/YqeY domain-containing protein n=1 Tax=Beggiatoa leptomitoformis TaxID=288004 RepID=A0A2N9YIH1_9GAMM|nr:GatB/YqeY domain-containing protein [Beggiatoa leptomitoformis]ALG67613.1 GatB/YqeY domain-containing protein [Beggiatoa leptomitoformis]AUI70155.1 GatB/YqeY domain-containing protein [Beggiatoa leptomitoformis]